MTDKTPELARAICVQLGRDPDEQQTSSSAAWPLWKEVAGLLHVYRALPTLSGAGEDAARLDWLDEQNARINAHYGTKYGWRYDVNHNRAAMLSDNHYPVKTVREAIDEARPTTPHREEDA